MQLEVTWSSVCETRFKHQLDAIGRDECPETMTQERKYFFFGSLSLFNSFVWVFVLVPKTYKQKRFGIG